MNITLERIDIKDLRQLIELAFMGDNKLLTTYHKNPGDLKHCVEDSYHTVVDGLADYDYGCEAYRILQNSERPIGFSVIFRKPYNILYSFGINRHFRTDKNKWGWLNAVKELFSNKSFVVVLHSNNTRAINYFVKNGFEKTEMKNNTVGLKYL